MAVGRPTHLFIVCSAHPRVGKTLVARLCVEFQHANGRPVAAFDLGSGEPALAEFLPEFAVPASIADMRGQMALFEHLASDDGAPKIVDVGHHALAQLLMLMRDVDFAAEARRRMIDPIILFVATPDDVSARVAAIMKHQFPDFGFLPISNAFATEDRDLDLSLFPSNLPSVAALHIPMLSPQLQAASDRRPCSFADLHRGVHDEVARDLWVELDGWLRQCFRQLRELDLALLVNDLDSSLG
jgi:hypothetical protein